MKKLLLFFLPVILILNGCSWQEYFVVSNESEKEVLIEYEIYVKRGGFPIFGSDQKVHKLTNNNQIDWEKQGGLNYHEKYNYNIDSSLTKISYRFYIPPKCAFIIGHLSNDHYENYNQYFINSRYFNIEFIKIYQNGNPLEILPAKFDKYFKRDDNGITYKIQ